MGVSQNCSVSQNFSPTFPRSSLPILQARERTRGAARGQLGVAPAAAPSPGALTPVLGPAWPLGSRGLPRRSFWVRVALKGWGGEPWSLLWSPTLQEHILHGAFRGRRLMGVPGQEATHSQPQWRPPTAHLESPPPPPPGARTRSPSPRAWRPDFPGAAREAP